MKPKLIFNGAEDSFAFFANRERRWQTKNPDKKHHIFCIIEICMYFCSPNFRETFIKSTDW